MFFLIFTILWRVRSNISRAPLSPHISDLPVIPPAVLWPAAAPRLSSPSSGCSFSLTWISGVARRPFWSIGFRVISNLQFSICVCTIGQSFTDFHLYSWKVDKGLETLACYIPAIVQPSTVFLVYVFFWVLYWQNIFSYCVNRITIINSNAGGLCRLSPMGNLRHGTVQERWMGLDHHRRFYCRPARRKVWTSSQVMRPICFMSKMVALQFYCRAQIFDWTTDISD